MASADGSMSLLGRFNFKESVTFISNNVAMWEENRNGLFADLALLNLEEADQESRFLDMQENRSGNLSGGMVSWPYNFSSDSGAFDDSSTLPISRTSISTLDFVGGDFWAFDRYFKLKNVKHSLLNLSDEKSDFASVYCRFDYLHSDFPTPSYQNFELHNDESYSLPDGKGFYDFDSHFSSTYLDFETKIIKFSVLDLNCEDSYFASGENSFDSEFPSLSCRNFEIRNDESDFAQGINGFADVLGPSYLDFELKNINLSLLDLNCEDCHFASDENGFDSDFPSPSYQNFEILNDESDFAQGLNGFSDFLGPSYLDFELKNIKLSLLDLNCEDSYFASDENGFDSDFPSPSFRNFAPDVDRFDDFLGPSYLDFELKNINHSLLDLNVADSVFASDENDFDDFDSDFPSPSYRLFELKCIKASLSDHSVVESEHALGENGFGDLDTDFPISYLDFAMKNNNKLSLLDLNGEDSDFTSAENVFDDTDSDFPSPSYWKKLELKNDKLFVVDRRNDESAFAPVSSGLGDLDSDFSSDVKKIDDIDSDLLDLSGDDSDFGPDYGGFNDICCDFPNPSYLDLELKNFHLSLLDRNGEDFNFASGENGFEFFGSDFPSPSYRDFELKNIKFSGYCFYDFDPDFPNPTYRKLFLDFLSTNEEFMALDDSDNEALFWPFDVDSYSLLELDKFCEDLDQQNLTTKATSQKCKSKRAQKSQGQQKSRKHRESKKGISKSTTEREEKTVKKHLKCSNNKLYKKEHPRRTTGKAVKEYVKGAPLKMTGKRGSQNQI